MSTNYQNYNGPNAIGSPKNLIPNWLDHTMNAEEDNSVAPSNAKKDDPGPNQPIAMSISKGT